MILLDSNCAIIGARDGIKLCLYTVLPSLFPYCVLSILFRSLITEYSFQWIRPLERLCFFPDGTGILFLLGLLGGYPIGAICVEKAVEQKQLSCRSARYLRAIYNAAGPSFIIGILGTIIKNRKLLFMLIMIQALSAMLTNLILSQKQSETHFAKPQMALSLSQAISQAYPCMLNVCGLIILSRVIISYIVKYLSKYISTQLWTIIAGTMELTNGILLLNNFQNEYTIFIIAAGMLSFGGLCVFMQTITISAPNTGKYYFIGKLIQTSISILLAAMFIIVRRIIYFISIYLIIFSCIRFVKSKFSLNLGPNKFKKEVEIQV